MRDLHEIINTIAKSDFSACVLTRDRRLIRTNDAWRRFAAANGGEEALAQWPEGSFIDSAMDPVFAMFYADAFEHALVTDTRWEHDYQCSSADMFRNFRMIVYPVNKMYLVIEHALLVEAPHTQEAFPANDAIYVSEGVISICAHCRRVRNHTKVLEWDWVPEYVRHPPRNLSHGFCDVCFAYYVPPE